jgi:hypothetical protein
MFYRNFEFRSWVRFRYGIHESADLIRSASGHIQSAPGIQGVIDPELVLDNRPFYAIQHLQINKSGLTDDCVNFAGFSNQTHFPMVKEYDSW